MDRLGNKRPRRGDGIPLNPVTLNLWVVGSIPARCISACFQALKRDADKRLIFDVRQTAVKWAEIRCQSHSFIIPLDTSPTVSPRSTASLIF